MTTILPVTRRSPEHLTDLGEYVNFNDDDEGEIRMNQAQFEGLVRIVLTAVASAAGVLGYVKGFDFTPLITLGVTLAVGWWSVHSNSNATMVATVAAQPEVKGVVMESKAAANSTPALAASTNVVGPTAQEIKKI